MSMFKWRLWYSKWKMFVFDCKQNDAFLKELKALNAPIERRLRRICAYDTFFILPLDDRKTTAFLFFRTDADVNDNATNGIVDEALNIIYEEVSRAGYGSREEVSVHFEIDSTENIKKNFNGDEWARMRG